MRRKPTTKPRKTTVQQIGFPDVNNNFKWHFFRIYSDRHVRYNQGILCAADASVQLQYKWERANRRHGYYDYLKSFKQHVKTVAKLQDTHAPF